MVVEFTEEFEKQLKKYCAKQEAKTIIKKLDHTKPTDGDTLTTIANVVLKERKIKTFRFYFVVRENDYRFMSEQELKECILRFVSISKKNNQQDVIDKIKDDLKRFGFTMK